MTFLFGVYLAGSVAMLVAGLLEQRRHYQSLHSIPHRVVINGIRGKSSITRLCAGALRGGGVTTVAKTTGTAARFIGPDGVDEPIYRKFGLANVIEQVAIVRRAAAYEPDALVIECMAVLPDLQEINERKLIHSTICVICNVREDHLAEMGPTLPDIARSLSRSMPRGGVCITAEKEQIAVLREEARRRNCELIQVDPDEIDDETVAMFPFITFKENIAIALAVAGMCGIERESALRGMITSPPDPGTVAVDDYQVDDRRLSFANLFAANDPSSTLMNIEQLAERGLIDRPLNIVINCRPDRVERNGQMGELTGVLKPDKIILIGEPTRSARTAVPSELSDKIQDFGSRPNYDELIESVVTEGGSGSVITIGNIHGQGEVLLEHVRKLPRAMEEAC
ncbi:poly-gamma-glutamate synthase PgsB [Mycobacterium sp. AMU20-3851]|uniref:poly-gamma-glutamate synthase PgsB n=1 Tax=Mycobacterium sp. AMU20-3851 TaxID=3122055 RepID=UPI003754E2D4